MSTEELLSRGVAKVIPRELAEKKLQTGPLRLYLGIDPTGAKLHLGHSVVLRKIQQFADAGHEVIFLIGSFTAMIGDPSGRDKLRDPLTKEEVMRNFETYKEQASSVVDFNTVDIRYNHEWLERLDFEDIIQLASQFTVQRMLERDMFAKRMKEGKPIHLHEFLYPLMVGFDSVVLDVDCEVGGNDQEFNMLAGRTLQTALGKRDKFILTTKILEGTDGRKMSKSFDNCIWLNDPPDEMYGKLMKIKDEHILTYLECCTDVSLQAIAEIEEKMRNGENPKQCKMYLARAIVRAFHGDDAAKAAEERFEQIFSKKDIPDDIQTAVIRKRTTLLDFLTDQKLASSRADARRLINQGAVRLDDAILAAPNVILTPGILRVGKRRMMKIII